MFQLLAIKQAPNKEVVSWGVPGRLDMSGKRVVPCVRAHLLVRWLQDVAGISQSRLRPRRS